MNGVEVLEVTRCNTLADLLSKLKQISSDLLHEIPDSYISLNDASVQVRVERQILTDGSEVYNVNIEA